MSFGGDARSVCQKVGGDLPSIHSVDENNWLTGKRNLEDHSNIGR